MTVEEWVELPEDVPGEIAAGRLVEEEMPDYVHEMVVAWLLRVLGNWAEEHGAIVGGSETKMGISAARGRKADATMFLAGRRPPRRGLLTIPPDVAVEVITPRPRDEQRDRITKPAEYAAFGIRWYWLVDPERRTLEIHELRSGAYVQVVRAVSGTVEVPGCPGLALSLDALWRKTDELA